MMEQLEQDAQTIPSYGTVQTLQPSKEVPIVIETPMGFVELLWQHGRRLRIKLPPGLTACRGLDRAKGSAKFVSASDEDPSAVRPKYSLLSPRVDESGFLIGLGTPSMIRLKGKET